MKSRKISTSIQLTYGQIEQLEKISNLKDGKQSNSSIIREAFDLYVKTKYPQISEIWFLDGITSVARAN